MVVTPFYGQLFSVLNITHSILFTCERLDALRQSKSPKQAKGLAEIQSKVFVALLSLSRSYVCAIVCCDCLGE